MNSTKTFKYCDLEHFKQSYEEVHGILSFLVCVFGSVANILNICVLTTKEMRWPTNLILTGLAVADLLVMLEYIPFSIHRYINLDDRKNISHFTYGWAIFMMFHAVFSQMFHFISCCLTVVLAIWRYSSITNPQNSRYWCDVKKTMYVIILTYLICPLICYPLYQSLHIVAYNQSCDSNGRIIDNKILQEKTGIVYNTIFVMAYVNQHYAQMSFWIYAVVIKLLPCILLTYLSRKLIQVLCETKKRKTVLFSYSVPLDNFKDVKPIINLRKKHRQADRTSGMLIAVLLLFLITEFPQSILGLLGATKGALFQKECYDPLDERFTSDETLPHT
ncbi:G-protein coupled receptor dmsr-1-like [Diorhabda carinulata]|uniref:G-protein coupled receptor dmsr-1-like n=1 Tax=Diorhabda carinulata TaxID=1163345 RepID=UPI0025A1BB14|nr:G-protein coupled receptor dmsr-1-like [Diorhabda carinulata]